MQLFAQCLSSALNVHVSGTWLPLQQIASKQNYNTIKNNHLPPSLYQDLHSTILKLRKGILGNSIECLTILKIPLSFPDLASLLDVCFQVLVPVDCLTDQQVRSLERQINGGGTLVATGKQPTCLFACLQKCAIAWLTRQRQVCKTIIWNKESSLETWLPALNTAHCK